MEAMADNPEASTELVALLVEAETEAVVMGWAEAGGFAGRVKVAKAEGVVRQVDLEEAEMELEAAVGER
jgi:hypothetical protein